MKEQTDTHHLGKGAPLTYNTFVVHKNYCTKIGSWQSINIFLYVAKLPNDLTCVKLKLVSNKNIQKQ